jgi:glycerophosphoryl diester phosphodiesterase
VPAAPGLRRPPSRARATRRARRPQRPGREPEHTLYAYDLALSLGADYIEQDLQLTKDSVLVVLHDATLDRTATGPKRNCNTVNYYIETKNPEEAPGMEEALLALIDKYLLRDRAVERRQVLIQSFSAASLQKIHALDPRLPLIQLYGTPVDTSAFATIAGYAVGIGPNKGLVNPAVVAAAHTQCLDIHPYTVNETGEMQALIGLGVDGMFTNFPERLDAVLGDSALVGKVAARRAARAGERCRQRA